MATEVKKSGLGVPLGGRTILGELTSYSNGSAKWTYAKDTNPLIAGAGDRSTFTLSKGSDGSWNWSPTTSTSFSNLASREGISEQTLRQSFYTKSGNQTTSPSQAVLNAGNVTNLGGITAAKKLGVPGTSGTATTTGTLPSQVSGNFAGQPGATPQPGDQQGGAGVDQNLTTVDNLKNEVKDDAGVRKDYPGKTGAPLVYPITRDPKQDYIKFTMFRYSPRAVNVGAAGQSGSVFGPRTPGELLGVVTLPIQPTISDTNSVIWGEDRMDPIAAVAQMASLQLISGEQSTKVLGEVADKTKENAGAAKAMIGFNLAQAAVGNQGGNLLTRATGGIVNPNLELLFQGPTLRSFTFNFTLSAREQKEAEVIKKIIRFFKQGMSVKRASTSLFLMSPNTFQISYIYGETAKDHPWINRIKECALQNFTVNYTPAGNYATYEDGAMTQYDLSLSFSELDPIYDDDYTALPGGNSDTEVGY